jgi:tricorn protease
LPAAEDALTSLPDASRAVSVCFGSVPNAGGIINTGSVSVMDVGSLRLPFRGWYGLDNGLDMELHGATPDHLIWPQPGELASGIDRQLDKAIDVHRKDVKTWQARPQPKLQKASERFFKP